jgi:hypothetical protein
MQAAEEVVEEVAEEMVDADSMDCASTVEKLATGKLIAGKMRPMRAKGLAIGRAVRPMSKQWQLRQVVARSSCV